MEIFKTESVIQVSQFEIRVLIFGVQLYLEEFLKPKGSNDESSGITSISEFKKQNSEAFNLLRSLYSISGLIDFYEAFLQRLQTKYGLIGEGND